MGCLLLLFSKYRAKPFVRDRHTESHDRQTRQSPGRHRFRLMQQTRRQKTEGHAEDWTHCWFNDSKKMPNDSFMSFLMQHQLIASD